MRSIRGKKWEPSQYSLDISDIVSSPDLPPVTGSDLDAEPRGGHSWKHVKDGAWMCSGCGTTTSGHKWEVDGDVLMEPPDVPYDCELARDLNVENVLRS